MLALILCGMPLFFMEAAMGQFTGRSPVQSWSVCPLVKGERLFIIYACPLLWLVSSPENWVCSRGSKVSGDSLFIHVLCCDWSVHRAKLSVCCWSKMRNNSLCVHINVSVIVTGHFAERSPQILKLIRIARSVGGVPSRAWASGQRWALSHYVCMCPFCNWSLLCSFGLISASLFLSTIYISLWKSPSALI